MSINYAPLVPEHTPLKICRIAFHSFQQDDGTGNFQDNAADREYLSNVIIAANNRLANLGQLNMGTTPYVQDSRIRLVLEDVYFHPHTSAWNYSSASTTYTTYVTNDLDGYGFTTDLKQNVQHVLLKGAGTTVGGSSPHDNQGYTSLAGWYNHYQDHGPGSYSWRILGNFIHELGHSFGCRHNFHGGTYGYQCDVCLDNDPIGLPCPIQGTSNNFMDYYPEGYNASNPDPGLSACQLGRMHYRLDGNLGTIHRIVLQDHCTYHPEESITINGTYTWLDSKKLKGDLVILPGSSLTVKCRVHMPAGSKVVVQQGGILIIDGGQFTNLCGDFWTGIEAWGTTTQHQYPASNPTYQGLVVLKNEAVIEHARNAITTWKPGDWNTRGGVIQVQGTHDSPGASFLNCRRSLEYMEYQNFQPGHPNLLRPNLGYFSYAHFEVNDDYRGGNDFAYHATLWGVDGIQFRACTMANLQTGITQSTQLGKGIASLDANYTVSGKCTVILPYGVPCPEANLDRGSFTGLGHGIDATDGGSGRGFIASNLTFENNIVGIYTSGLSNFTAIKNHFILGDRDVTLDGPVDNYFNDPFHRAISTQSSYGFRIEENTIESANDVLAAGVDGIVIANSGSSNTQVYKNFATELDNAYVGEGKCMDYFQASSIGHQFLCNTNTLNAFNITARTMAGDTWNHSIRTQQGSNASHGGNTFDQEVVILDESDFKNRTDWVLNYWHGGGNTEPLDVTPGWVGVTLADGTNNCPSRLSGRQIRLSNAGLSEVTGDFSTAKSAYINTAYVFNSLLDGGNTDVVVDEVQATWPNDAWELRNYLMSKSPNLSTAVLVEMIKKHVLPQAMELEVCLANPEATKKEGFVKWVEFEAEYPFPSYMIDLIAGSWEGKTFRMQLEAEMGAQHADMSVAADVLQAHFQADTTGVPADSMLYRWQQLPNYNARLSEVQLLLRKADYDGARGVLNNLESQYPMKDDRIHERDGALWFVERMEDLHTTGRTTMELDASELATFETFARDRFDFPGTWVKNILCFGYDICLPDPAGREATPKALRPTKPNASAGVESLLRILPNPATVVATLKHDVNDPLDHAFLRVVDASGREVVRIPITTSPGQTLLDTRELSSGLYTVEFFNNNARMATERLVVQTP